MTHVKFLVDRLPDGFREIQEILEALLGEGSLNPCDIVLLEGALKNSKPRVRARAFRGVETIKDTQINKCVWGRLPKEKNDISSQ